MLLYFHHLQVMSPFLPSLPRHNFFVSRPNQSFSFCPELILPSLIIDAILQTSLTTSSRSNIALLLLLLYLVFYPSRSALHHSSTVSFLSTTHYKWHCFALSSYVVTSAEGWNNVLIGCGWHCSACCRIGAMHKMADDSRQCISGTDGAAKIDYLSIRIGIKLY